MKFNCPGIAMLENHWDVIISFLLVFTILSFGEYFFFSFAIFLIARGVSEAYRLDLFMLSLLPDSSSFPCFLFEFSDFD